MPAHSAILLPALLVAGPVIAHCQGTGISGGANDGLEIKGELHSVVGGTAKALNRLIGLVEDSLEMKACQIASVYFVPDGLRDGLDSIVSQSPSYTWRKEGESVFLLPRRDVKSPLELSIRSFALNRGTVLQARESVMNRPELRQWMRANDIRVFDLESPAPSHSPEARFSVNLGGVTLREVLDGVARASGKMFWRIVWFDHDTFMGIYF